MLHNKIFCVSIISINFNLNACRIKQVKRPNNFNHELEIRSWKLLLLILSGESSKKILNVWLYTINPDLRLSLNNCLYLKDLKVIRVEKPKPQ